MTLNLHLIIPSKSLTSLDTNKFPFSPIPVSKCTKSDAVETVYLKHQSFSQIINMST